MEFIEDNDEFEFSCTPPDVAEAANIAVHNLLPEKSRERYEKAYKSFGDWCKEKKIRAFTENVFLGYFSELANAKKSSTLWSIFSMLKSTLAVKDNVDIGKYSKLIAFLKRKSVGHRAKKSKVLTRDEINSFLFDAPDDRYLMIKVG